MDIEELTNRIKDEYEQSLRSARDGINHAINIGTLLKTAKEAVKHGQWKNWILENFRFGVRQAQKYLRLAENAELVLAIANSNSLLNIDGALRIIATVHPNDRCNSTPAVPSFDIDRHLQRGKNLIRKWLDKAPVEDREKLRVQLAEWADNL